MNIHNPFSDEHQHDHPEPVRQPTEHPEPVVMLVVPWRHCALREGRTSKLIVSGDNAYDASRGPDKLSRLGHCFPCARDHISA